MPLQIGCPHCGKHYSVREDVLGKAARCKGCGQTFTMAAPVLPTTSRGAAAPARPPATRSRAAAAPPPQAAEAEADPFAAMAELEATGQALGQNQFYQVPNNQVSARGDYGAYGVTSTPVAAPKKHTTIHDADPAEAARRQKMSRRAMLAGGGSIGAFGLLGGIGACLKLAGRGARAYNRNQQAREREERQGRSGYSSSSGNDD